ncbi:alpha-keto-acid decarboxylase [Arthrobacter sp. StoSoilA2]|uniref:alpha-keto acid decarboxylase family protein n=1 Tax=Arthrobacter sp. StoSoilA2 TaxID=2830990 RepID=UPI001E706E42|nr:thiamine pyrophosphate-binding protein [Arthrobacter sp. StoSoilA2]BCW36022.1 alpha-keto-acid decarboxylase [Arthrobacter sp. StoSoilA2]
MYLATRLVQCGVHHLFGLPGDFNLSLLDEMLTVDELTWVGSTNELNAAYAADGYARAGRKLGALSTTYGVGEMSAINGIAGAYAEDVPVVQITGFPSTSAAAEGLLLHHTLIDSDYNHFFRAYKEVTAAAAILTAATASRDIDRVLLAAMRESKPVYLAIPTDVAVARVPDSNLRDPLAGPRSDPAALSRFTRDLYARLQGTAEVTVLAGPRLHRRRLEDTVRRLAEVPGVHIASQPGAKAIVDESHPSSLGTYMGAITRSQSAREAVDQAPVLILAGVVLSDLLTGFFSHRFDPRQSVDLGMNEAHIDQTTYYGVTLEDSLNAVESVLHAQRVITEGRPVAPAATNQTVHRKVSGTDISSGSLTQDAFWSRIQAWLPDDAIVIADAGTAFCGALELKMPNNSDLLGQPVWSSIGYTLPATLGTSLAAPEQRSVLFIGDGSAQLTIQELTTILHQGLSPIIFLINNEGYTVERAIQSPHAVYQDVYPWNWTALPGVLAPGIDSVTTVVSTGTELETALETAAATTGKLVFIEVLVPKLDTPSILTELAAGLADANSSA